MESPGLALETMQSTKRNARCPAVRAWKFRLKLAVSATQIVVYVLKGHDFSRAVCGLKMTRALAPEGSFFYDSSIRRHR